MTEFELIDVYHSAEASWQGAAGIFISTVFAYLMVAYLVGAKLNRTQVTIVTILYVVFSVAMLGAQFDIISRMAEFAVAIEAANPEQSFIEEGRGRGAYVFTGIFFFTFLAGLVFMYQIRRSLKQRG